MTGLVGARSAHATTRFILRTPESGPAAGGDA
jgi:hypothetical protein